LLGWKAVNESMTKKIIEILFIDKKKVRFGHPLLKSGSVYKNRIIFTYDSHSTMSLRYEEGKKGIVFDHISQNKNNPSALSGPDGTYDIFKLKKGKWVLYKDIDASTDWVPSENLPKPPPPKEN